MGVIPFVLFFALGFILVKANGLVENWLNVINNIVFYFTLPNLIMATVLKSKVNLLTETILLKNLLAYLIFILISYVASRCFYRLPGERGIFILCSNLGNFAYFGFPILQILYGVKGLEIGVLISLVHIVAIYVILPIALINDVSKKASFGEIAKIPLVWAVCIAIAIKGSTLKFPDELINIMNVLGSMSSPIILVALGIYIGNYFKRYSVSINKQVILSTFFRLVIAPLVFLMLIHNENRFDVMVSVILISMPCGFTSFVLSEKYNLNSATVTKIIFFSTLVSMLTIPIWNYILSIGV